MCRLSEAWSMHAAMPQAQHTFLNLPRQVLLRQLHVPEQCSCQYGLVYGCLNLHLTLSERLQKVFIFSATLMPN